MKKKFDLSQKSKRKLLIEGLFYLFGVILFIVYGFITWQDSSSPTFRKYVFIPWFIFFFSYRAVESFYNRLHQKIIISDDQIEYYSFQDKFKVSWKELHAIEEPILPLFNFEFVTAYIKNKRKSFINKSRYVKKIIPVSFFDEEWREKSLGKHIKNYAPKLFELDT